MLEPETVNPTEMLWDPQLDEALELEKEILTVMLWVRQSVILKVTEIALGSVS